MSISLFPHRRLCIARERICYGREGQLTQEEAAPALVEGSHAPSHHAATATAAATAAVIHGHLHWLGAGIRLGHGAGLLPPATPLLHLAAGSAATTAACGRCAASGNREGHLAAAARYSD